MLLLLLLGGCGPAVVLENPAGWPGEFAGRKLYHTPNAYIYATSEAAAGEIDRRMVDVAGDFETASGAASTKGLFFVVDTGDPSLFPDADKLWDAMARAAAKAKERGQAVVFDLGSSREEADEKLQELGLQSDELLMMGTIVLSDDILAETLGLPPCVAETAPWAMTMPTGGAFRSFGGKMIRRMLKKEGLGMQLVALPWMPLIEGAMADMSVATSRITLFQTLAHQATDWAAEERDKCVGEYADRQMKKAMGLLGALAGG